MPTVTVTLPSDNTTAVVAQYNVPITTILSVLNGFLDDANIASLSGTKITAGTIPSTAFDTTSKQGYYTGIAAPNSVTYNGNRSYSMVFNGVDYTSTLYPGTRLKMTRSVAAPTQCTSLNGSTQYYNNTSSNKLAFTNNFVCSGWIKLSSYAAGSIISRYNGTSGWDFSLNASGQVQLIGYNASSANFSQVLSYQSVPLNKWVHVAAQLDMATFTATPTTSYVMFDGVDVPAAVSRGGTNPTALIQAGNLEVGSRNGGTQPFPGKLAQVAVFSAKVTETTMQGYISQGLAGTETSLASAYSFNNSIADLNTTTPNNLTANGSAVATTADSPFGQNVYGVPTGTTEFGIVQQTTFSTNSTVVVQVPEGCAIPTANGVSAIVYSSIKAPAAFPIQEPRWAVEAWYNAQFTTVASVSALNQWFIMQAQLSVPVGVWKEIGYEGFFQHNQGGSSNILTTVILASPTPTNGVLSYELISYLSATYNTLVVNTTMSRKSSAVLGSSTVYALYVDVITNSGATTILGLGQYSPIVIRAKNGYL